MAKVDGSVANGTKIVSSQQDVGASPGHGEQTVQNVITHPERQTVSTADTTSFVKQALDSFGKTIGSSAASDKVISMPTAMEGLGIVFDDHGSMSSAASSTSTGVPTGTAGPGIAYKKSDTKLPGELNALQKTQQINFLADAKPPIYITSSPDNPSSFKIYDAQGKPFNIAESYTPPQAIGLNNGQWLVLNKGGVAKTTLVTDTSTLAANTFLRVLDQQHPGSTKKVANPKTDTQATTADGKPIPAAPDGAINGTGVSDGSAGPGIAYQSSEVKLPGDLNALQKTQQVNYIADANPPIYVTSSDDKKGTFKIYDANGKPFKLTEVYQPPQAIGLNNGKWLVLATGGLSKTSLVTDTTNLPSNTFFRTLDEDNPGTTKKADVKALGTSTQPIAKADAWAMKGKALDAMNDTHPSEERADTDPYGNKRKRSWLGAKTTDNKTVFVDVNLPVDGDTSGKVTPYLYMKDDKGADKTPDDLRDLGPNKPGKFSYKNGPTLYVTDKGYYLVNGGQARDIVKGVEVDAQAVLDEYAKTPGTKHEASQDW